jgi:hypothetical protein
MLRRLPVFDGLGVACFNAHRNNRVKIVEAF